MNFLMIAGTLLIFGLGLGWSIYKKVINPVSVIFTLFGLGFVVATIFPTGPATPTSLSEILASGYKEKIHDLMALMLVSLSPLLLYPVFVSLKKSPQWRSLLPYTIGVFVFNCVVGWLWIYLLGYDWFWEWKGLLQKILITNILVWMVVMGRRMMKMSQNSVEKDANEQELPVYPLSSKMEEKGQQAVEEYKAGQTIEVTNIDEYFASL